MYWYYCLTLFVCIYVCIYNLPLYTIYSLILHVYFHMLSIFIYLIIPYLFKISNFILIVATMVLKMNISSECICIGRMVVAS
jgi:hypothetical protein